ncbi:hypothetical protein ACG7TL_007418 [Trametes sanguinea]
MVQNHTDDRPERLAVCFASPPPPYETTNNNVKPAIPNLTEGRSAIAAALNARLPKLKETAAARQTNGLDFASPTPRENRKPAISPLAQPPE